MILRNNYERRHILYYNIFCKTLVIFLSLLGNQHVFPKYTDRHLQSGNDIKSQNFTALDDSLDERLIRRECEIELW